METHPYTRLDLILIVALAALALAAGIWVATDVTQRIPHLEDEMAYIFQARVFARGALWAPEPPDHRSFFLPFVLLVNGHWIGKYPVGWPLVLAAGELLDAGWLVNPLLGALTAAVTYCLGRDVYDRQVGLIAGLLAISSPFFLILAGTFMSHTVGGLWVAVLLWSWRRIELAQAAGGSGRGWSTLGGAALGMLAITRPLTGVAVGAVFGLALAVQATRRHRELQRVLRAYAPLAGVALLIALLQPLWLWLSTGSPTTNLYTMVWEYDRVGFGPEVGRTGHTLGEGLRTAWRDLQLWAGDLFGWRYLSWLPPALGVVLGVWRGGPGRRGWPLLLAGPFVALVVFYLAYWIGAQLYGPRYYYEAHAGLAVLAALGLRETVRLVAGGGGERSPGGWRDLLGGDAALVYIPLAALIALNLVAYLPQRLPDWRDVYDITPAPFKALREQAGNQPVLVIVQGGRWVDYAPFFAHNSPWLDGPTVAAHDVSPGVNAAIIRQYPGYSVWFYSEGVLTPIRPAVAGEE